MTGSRFALIVPAGSSLTFTGIDGVQLERPRVGTLERSISLRESFAAEGGRAVR